MFQPKQNVCKWANSFKEGRTSVEDGERIVATVSDWLRHQSKDFYGEGYRPFWLLFPRWFAHLFGPITTPGPAMVRTDRRDLNSKTKWGGNTEACAQTGEVCDSAWRVH